VQEGKGGKSKREQVGEGGGVGIALDGDWNLSIAIRLWQLQWIQSPLDNGN
jgi:hypothetical protein